MKVAKPARKRFQLCTTIDPNQRRWLQRRAAAENRPLARVLQDALSVAIKAFEAK